MFDFDNDGDLDICSANGTAEELILQYPLLLENDGRGNFKDIGAERCDYFKEKRSGRTLAVWDYDNDGDLDIIISHVDLKATAALLKNEGGNRNYWLGLTLKGANGPASASVEFAPEDPRVRKAAWQGEIPVQGRFTRALDTLVPRLVVGVPVGTGGAK